MIDQELAERLKAAGLVWNPTYGDEYIVPDEYNQGEFSHETITIFEEIVHADRENGIWLQRLDQLLEEIEQRGYYPEINKEEDGKYRCILYGFNPVGYFYEMFSSEVIGNTWEEAAGKELLWIIKEQMIGKKK
jgi:hypothetical protein